MTADAAFRRAFPPFRALELLARAEEVLADPEASLGDTGYDEYNRFVDANYHRALTWWIKTRKEMHRLVGEYAEEGEYAALFGDDDDEHEHAGGA